MKKLLTLVLVLAVAGLANAGLSIAYQDGKVVVASDEPLLGGIAAGVASTGPDISAVTLTLRTEGAPNAEPGIFGYTGADLDGFGITGYPGGAIQLAWGDPDPQVSAAAGFWFSFDLPGMSEGTPDSYIVRLDLTDLNVDPSVYGQSLYLIPEPMTMVLLGLGGLFIRRK